MAETFAHLVGVSDVDIVANVRPVCHEGVYKEFACICTVYTYVYRLQFSGCPRNYSHVKIVVTHSIGGCP